ncbi:MAG: Coenzyme F420 hydrogenase/dehydrogenase, beta subunit C-terminal domain [Oscillospiraceae bacterium]|nr:Coenzyme F420 hydrogenase/dehydrogenase, beta subunit C-terminal domain [Oscillospiraceae bacterium]
MIYFESHDKRDCFGCSACAQSCPSSAISMRADGEGFSYPVVEEGHCIHCGKCFRSCPALQPRQMKLPIQAMAVVNKEKYIRTESSSGGAFGAIVSAASADTVVFGVKWEGRSKACHAGVPASQAYAQFHKSKYIQSNIKNTYQEAKKCLVKDVPVIFIGTPCQIAGLMSFLGRDYSNLLCVDLVCHGVSSEKVLEEYLCKKDRKNNPVKGIDFRYKNYSCGKWDSKCAQIHYEKGKSVTVDYNSSGFLRGFANGLFFRPSCSTCPYAQYQRISDLTIGDYWGIEKEISLLDPHEGVSLVFVNTEKGHRLFHGMEKFTHVYPTNIDSAVNGNARLRKPDPGHSDRDYFFSKLGTEDFERLVQKCVPRISTIRKWGHKVKKIMGK